MPKSRKSRETSAASTATSDSAASASAASAHSSRSSTPTVTVTQTQTPDASKHVQIETPDRTPNGTPPPAGESRLRQRFKSVREELGKSMDDISVRIRNKGDGNYKVLAPGTPYDELELHQHHKGHKHHQKDERGWKKWFVGRRALFPIAFVLGAAAVWLTTAPDLLPADLSDVWPMLQADMRDFLGNLTITDAVRKNIFENRDFTVADDLIEKYGLKADHPIVLMPGIISTGLESWSTEPVARSMFRSRLWGTSTMIRTVLTDKEKWTEAIAIDLKTGLDPPGHKVRAAQGLDAASEFIQGYWIWQKIVQNLAAIGYDTSTMDMAAYDWRVAFYNLEVRDFFLTRLKVKIEVMRQQTGKKVVLASHSMGGSLALYFFKWVEADPKKCGGFGGGGGPHWVEDNIDSWVNIAGTLLGVPKAMTAFLSGEMRDTVEIHPLGSYMLEKFFSRKERAKLFRNWPGASSMWMKGGNRIWGNDTFAPDDPENTTDTFGRFLSFRNTSTEPVDKELTSETVHPNLTVDDTGPYILEHTSSDYQRMYQSNYSGGFESDVKQLKKNAFDPVKWSNPLEVQLPDAPSMKIYCLYGHGKETERSYWYAKGEWMEDENRGDAVGKEAICEADDEECLRTPGDFPMTRDQWIDTEVTDKGATPEVRSGVKFSDGDGTIATVSLGAMCVKGWKGKTPWNPAGIKVVTQEYKHQPDSFDLRGGPLTADHVDILGSSPLNAAILEIAAERGDLVEPTIGSNITDYVERMDWGGAF